MNNFLIFSSSPIFLLFMVSMIVRMEQYISCPLSFRNPPDIFCLFFTFLRSRSEILSSNRALKSCRNSRWLWLYFFILLSSFISSAFAYLWDVFLFSSQPWEISEWYCCSYLLISPAGNDVSPCSMRFFRALFISHSSEIIPVDHLCPVSSVFLRR